MPTPRSDRPVCNLDVMHTEHDNERRRRGGGHLSEVHNTAKRESTEVDETAVTYD